MPETTYRQHRFRRPAGACEILLVRHGESEPEVPGHPAPTVDGHGDPALAPEGHVQAHHVADRLESERLDAIYISTLRRTAQTAAPLAERTGLVPTVEADLREVFLGEWEGTFRQRMASGDPLARRMLLEGRWDVIPGAETQEEFAGRTTAAIQRIASANPDRRVAAFCHGGVIGQLMATASKGGNPFAFTGADNGSISHLVVTPDRWVLRRFNDTSHLPGGLDLPGAGADHGCS